MSRPGAALQRDAAPASYFLAAAVLLLVFALCLTKLIGSDLWWYLASGRYIAENLSLPVHDPFSYTMHGGFVVPHEWLFHLLMFEAYDLGGPAAVIVLKALLFAAAFGVLMTMTGELFWAPLVLAAAALATRQFMIPRPYMFDFLLLALTLKGLSGPGSGSLFWRFPLLVAVWTNVHGGASMVAVGLAVLRAFVALKEGRKARFWAAVAACGAAATLASPSGLALYSHLYWHVKPGSDMRTVSEWQRTPAAYYAGLYGTFLAAGFAAAWRRRRSDPFLALAAAALGLFSMTAVRHTAFAVLASSVLVARALAARWPVRPRLSRTLPAALLAGAGAWLHVEAIYPDFRNLAGLGEVRSFDRALQFLDDHGVKGNGLYDAALGGLVLWKEWPRRLAYTYSAPMFGPEFFRWYVPSNWAELDRRYQFDFAVLENAAYYQAGVFDRDPAWVPVYWDDEAVVYVRQRLRFRSVIESFGYHYLQPNQPSFSYLVPLLSDPAYARGVMEEADRSIAQAPGAANPLLLKAFLLEAAGRRAETAPLVARAESLVPLKPGPWFEAGWLKEAEGDLESAARLYRRAQELARLQSDPPSEAQAWNNLGAVSLRLGRRDEARRSFERALKLDPELREPREALSRLSVQKTHP